VERAGNTAVSTRATRSRSFAVEIWLVVLVLVTIGPLVKSLTAQPAARYALTASVWDQHTVDITGYPIGMDKIVRPDGRIRSDKAPAQPFLAVPVYAVGRVLGAEPGTHLRENGNLGLWWVTLWSSVLPLAVLIVMMRRVGQSLGSQAPTAAALAIAGGTTLGVFGSQLFGHVLAAALAFGAWYVLRRAPADRVVPWMLGGLLLGLAVITEYPVILVGFVLGAFVLVRAPKRIPAFILGGIPPALLGAMYNSIALGSPTRMSYSEKAASNNRSFLWVRPPIRSTVVDLWTNQRGLVLMTPLVIIAVVLAVWQARRHGPARTDAIVGLACFVLFLALQSGWSNAWGGDSPGPRYMVPALPFLAAPLAVGWHRVRRIAIPAATWGAFWVVASQLIDPLIARHNDFWQTTFAALARGHFSPTIWTMGLGTAGWALHLLLVAVAGIGLVRACEREREAQPVNDADGVSLHADVSVPA
jgi:hypothetical protein